MLDFWKDRRSDLERQADLYRTDGPRERASLIQRAYHHNFEGYTEVSEVNEKGKTVTRRVYTGKYYEPALESYRRVTLRIMYLLFFVGAAALFLYCATRNVICNMVFYVTAFQGITLLLLIWMGFTLACYIPSTGKMTIGEYKSKHRSLVRASRAAAIGMWAVAAASILCAILHIHEGVLSTLLCAAGFGVCGLLLFVIFLFESHLKYNVTDSGNTAPEDGFEIE